MNNNLKNLRKRALALFLTLAMCLSLLPATAMAAEDSSSGSLIAHEEDPNGPKITKTVSWDDEGYKVRMDAYVTGSVTTTTTSTPTDIVLVLDMSGSMDYCIKHGSSNHDNHYYAVYADDGLDTSATYYRKSGNSYYPVTYKDGDWKDTSGNKYTPKANANASGTQFYAKCVTRLSALKTAVNGFIDTIAEKNSEITEAAQRHKLGIVTFNATATTQKNLTAVTTGTDTTGDTNTSWKRSVNNYSATGGTRTDRGLTAATNMLGTKVEGRNQVVVLFTDGTPGRQGFTGQVAKDAIAEAKNLKSKDVVVYTISVLEGADPSVVSGTSATMGNSKDADNNYYLSSSTDTSALTNTFMNAVSSNYKSASATYSNKNYSVTLGNGSPTNGYYKVATEAGQLNSIFAAISNSISSPSVTVGKEAVLYDTMSNFFTLLEDAEAEDVKVWKVPATTFTTDAETNVTTFTFESDETKWVDMTGKVTVTVTNGKVEVTGFDYSKLATQDDPTGNCVLPAGTKQEPNKAIGYKLVIEFPIIPNTDCKEWGTTGDYNTNNGAGIKTKNDDGEDVSFEVKDNVEDQDLNELHAPVDTYSVSYSWSGAPTETVYDAEGEVVTLTVPSDSRHYISGQDYESKATEMTVYTHDDFGNVNGKYALTWNATEGGKMGEADVSYTGTWTYEDVDVAEATVNFTASTGGELVDGDMTDTGVVNRPFPEVPATEAEAGYHFDGWYVDDVKVATFPEKVTENVTYTAKFVENDKHSVRYSWTGLPETYYEDDSVETKDAANLTEPATESYPEGVTYTVDATSYGPVYTHDTNSDGSTYINGKYAFSGWDAEGEKTMGNQDVEYTGEWRDVTDNPVDPDPTDPDPVPGLPKYGVTYEVTVDGPETKATLPGATDDEKYFVNQEVLVSPVVAELVEDEDNNGFWSFSGWELNGKKANETEKMVEGGLTFAGTWTFTKRNTPLEDISVRYFVKWLDEDGNELKTSEVRGPEAVGTKVEVTEADKADISKDGCVYSFNEDAENVLEGTLSKDSLVVLTLYFTKTAVPATPLENIKARYIVKWLDEDGNELKTEVRGPEAVGTKVEVTEADKANITKDGVTYMFNAGSSMNVLEGTLSADGVVILTLCFGQTGMPTNPPVVPVEVAYLVQHWLEGAAAPFDTDIISVELADRDATVDVLVHSDDIRDVEGYSYNQSMSEIAGTVEFGKVLILKLVYTKNPEPKSDDIVVTKTAGQETAKVGETVTWEITVTNRSADYPYVGLRLVDLLNGVENTGVTISEGIYSAFNRDAGIALIDSALEETAEVIAEEPAEEAAEEITEEPAEEAAEEIAEEPAEEAAEEITEETAEDLDQMEMSEIFAAAIAADPANFDLWPGETVTFTVSYVVKDGDIKLENVAVVYGDTTDPDEPDPQPLGSGESEGIDIVYPSNLSVRKIRTSAATATVGSTITWDIVITNNGKGDAENVVVSDRLSNGRSATLDQSVVNVPAGETVTVHATYVVTEADAGSTLTNTVVVTDPVYPDDPADDKEVPGNDEGTEIPEISEPDTPVVPPVTPPAVIPPAVTPLAPTPGTIIDDGEVPLAAPNLNSTDHFDYVKGYEDGTVRPEANITRAEVATIFFRLMTNEYRMENWATENDFSDVPADEWYNNAISTATKAGLLSGYPEGDFRPDAHITRAEFATIAARFTSDEDVQTGRFSDIAGHWAEMYIERAAAAGWITGENGKFRPDDYITRAEVIVVVNRMLDRVPDADHMLDDMKKWVDNTPDMWWYADVQEATNSHDYERVEGGLSEIWTELLEEQDWLALEEVWATAADAHVADVAAGLNGGSGSEAEGETEAETPTEAEGETEAETKTEG